MQVNFNWAKVEKDLEELSLKVSQKVHDEVEREIEKGAKRIERDAAKGAPVNLGDLRDSIESRKVSGSGINTVWEVRVNAPQGVFMEFGTKPHWAPLDPLLDWVLEKKIAADENDAWIVADAIRAKIAREGTKAQPFFRPAFYKNERVIRDGIRRAIGRALKG